MLKYLFILILTLPFLQVRAQLKNTITEEIVTVEDKKDWQVFKINEMQGIKKTLSGEIILDAQYTSITEALRGIFILTTSNEKMGIYNARAKRMILQPEFTALDVYHIGNQNPSDTNFVILVGKEKMGLLNYKGDTILQQEYQGIFVMPDHAQVNKNGKVGIYFFDHTIPAIPFEYNSIKSQHPSKYFIGVKNKSYFLLNSKGNMISENNKKISLLHSSWESKYAYQFLVTNSENKSSVFDAKIGRFLFPFKYDYIGDNFRGNYIIKLNNRFGVVDSTATIKVPLGYDSISFLNPKPNRIRVSARNKNKVGLIDLNEKKNDLKYDDLEDINDDFYKVKLNNKYAIINAKGVTITKSTYDHIGSIYDNKVVVMLGDKLGYINVNGKEIEPITRISDARGYTTLNSLFNGFTEALRSDNDSTLMKFARDALFDEHTKELLLRINFSYRGFPDKIIKDNISIDHVAKSLYKEMLYFRDKIKRRDNLSQLVYISLNGAPPGYVNLSQSIIGTQGWGKFKTNNNEYTFMLGDLLYLDGYWKSFINVKK